VTTAESWLEQLAAALGVSPPSPTERDRLLGVAGVAAHAAERTAAPLTCWLIGRAGVEPEAAARVVADLARRLATEPEGD